MEELKYNGGARLGIRNVTWPFASLSISSNKVILNASLFGNYYFLKEDIISFEPYSSVSNGIRINHKVPQYNKHLIFWTPNPQSIIEQINLFYNSNNGKEDDALKPINEIRTKQAQGAFPLKTEWAISIAIVWFILFGLGLWISSIKGNINPKKLGVLFSFSFILVIAVCLIVLKPFRRIVLKENRELNDINRLTYAIMVISLIATLSKLF